MNDRDNSDCSQLSPNFATTRIIPLELQVKELVREITITFLGSTPAWLLNGMQLEFGVLYEVSVNGYLLPTGLMLLCFHLDR